MKIIVTTVAIGSWYPRGAERLVKSIDAHHHGEIDYSVILTPDEGMEDFIEHGYDYRPYAMKPRALQRALDGHDIAILCDASFWAIRRLDPLIDHIAKYGYYLCNNGFTVGQWCSDRCRDSLGDVAYDARDAPEVSSYCVGARANDCVVRCLVREWRVHSSPATICGHHTNGTALSWGSHHVRNRGPVSKDSRVRGHRHDQTVLSIVADSLGLKEFVNRPRFTAYAGAETDETVLVCEGMKE